jgi:hypothetical protein
VRQGREGWRDFVETFGPRYSRGVSQSDVTSRTGPPYVDSMTSRHIAFAALLAALASHPALAQTAPAGAARPASETVVAMVGAVEKNLTGVADAMPDDKYGFAPTAGAFRNVRDFAEQIKHAAAVQHLVAATILGERVTSDMSDERGPDAARTKAEVLHYLKDSFAALKRAAGTVTEKNAFEPFKGPFGAGSDTRIGLIVLAVGHSQNHYGQVVEYLRMNGIIPPQSQ